MGAQTGYTENYTCVKCHGKIARARSVYFLSSSLRDGLFSRYIAVTCGLCAYTEFYDSRISATVTGAPKDTDVLLQEL